MSRDLERVRHNWETFAATDPMWGILAHEGKRGAWDEDEFFDLGRRDVDALWEQIGATGVTLPSDRALDFGCGIGRLSRFIADRFDRVDGVDISEAMIVEAQTRNLHPDRCFFHHYDGGDLTEFADRSFGLVVSLITLQHVPSADACRYLSDLCRLVRPDGILAVQVPARQSPSPLPAVTQARRWVRRFVEHRIRRRPRMEMHTMDPAVVERVLAGQGLLLIGSVPDGRAGTWGESLLHVGARR